MSKIYTISHELGDAVNRARLTVVYGGAGGAPSNNFTSRQIRDAASTIEEGMVTKGGVYGHRLTEHKPETGRKSSDALHYTGKAVLFGPRERQYVVQPWNEKNAEYSGTHFTAIRGALKRERFILMGIDFDHFKRDDLLAYGEQGMICLLET